MKRFLGNKRTSPPVAEEKITDAMLGTGEQMCTCAAIVADIIIEQGQEKASLKELLEKARSADTSTDEYHGAERTGGR